MKCRKIHVEEIEAIRYEGDFITRDGTMNAPEWIFQAWTDGTMYFAEEGELFIKSRYGRQLVSIDDYIVKNMEDGTIYPYKPSAFHSIYTIVP